MSLARIRPNMRAVGDIQEGTEVARPAHVQIFYDIRFVVPCRD